MYVCILHSRHLNSVSLVAGMNLLFACSSVWRVLVPGEVRGFSERSGE